MLAGQRSRFVGGWVRRRESGGAKADPATEREGGGLEEASVRGGGDCCPLVALQDSLVRNVRGQTWRSRDRVRRLGHVICWSDTRHQWALEMGQQKPRMAPDAKEVFRSLCIPSY